METATNQLIALHSLEGRAGRQLMDVSREHFQTPLKVSESIWGALGGVATGAAAGLWADLHAGGFTSGRHDRGCDGRRGRRLCHRPWLQLVRGDDSRVHWSRDRFPASRCAWRCCATRRSRTFAGAVASGRAAASRTSGTNRCARSSNTAPMPGNGFWKMAVQEAAMPEVVHREMSRLLHESATGLLRRLYPSVKLWM